MFSYRDLTAAPPVPPGTRIRLLDMPNDPAPVPTGSTGTVTEGSNNAQLWIKWDNGRSLLLLVGVDSYEVLHQPQYDFDIDYENRGVVTASCSCGDWTFDARGQDQAEEAFIEHTEAP